MPKIEVEITRVRTIEETLTLEVNVPQRVLDDDELYEWVEENAAWTDGEAEATDEDTELREVQEIEE